MASARGQSPSYESPKMHNAKSVVEPFEVTPVQTTQVLAPRMPAIAALAAARRAPYRRKKLKRRTRDSLASQLYNLELDVMDLKQEIRRLGRSSTHAV
ncbi:hypothetical protein PF005_g14919 [Phytophthora fragariae]|nr:hypothetical protein PF003_g4114 [Phytophthora fragariae]KAE9001291.1 hypothetical protein PF011_g13799 [Phytophthora fragariae]KAE9201554.1 hypothetical protein PF005_g14919 [Phytophthora fragariae]KAE9219042.1 hypothetical protein PF002_g16311 [Phytophthora fragariae]KAE9301277.1 hypothetical protein PF001_g14527 [Phytophthora fragariae]